MSRYRGQFKAVVRVDLSEISVYEQNGFNSIQIFSFFNLFIMEKIKMTVCISLFLMDNNLSDSYPLIIIL